MTIGIRMLKVPQEVPVAKARNAATRKITIGRKPCREPADFATISATKTFAPRRFVIPDSVQAIVRIIDSRIAHLARIGKSLWLICLANLIIGVVNIIDGQTFSIVNLLCSVLLAYGLGRIHGMKASLEEERALHE